MSDEQTDVQTPAPDHFPPPKILANKPRDERTMHVEYALPGLRRATVHVPYDRWQDGGHAPVGQALADMLAELDLQTTRVADSVPS